jgi:cation transport regulator
MTTDPKPSPPAAGNVDCYSRVVGGDGSEFTIVPPDAAASRQEPTQVYPSNEELPDDVRAVLPPVVQTLYREAYNRAFSAYSMPLRRGLVASHDQVARQAAWKAVKRLYTQIGTTWVRKRT